MARHLYIEIAVHTDPDMAAESADWEKITPQLLLPAVGHIRTSFKTGHWKCFQITEILGYAALHPHITDLASLAHYKAPFEVYRQINEIPPSHSQERQQDHKSSRRNRHRLDPPPRHCLDHRSSGCQRRRLAGLSYCSVRTARGGRRPRDPSRRAPSRSVV